MAYPARNFEKDPSKRTKGWYMVPGKGRRYWDGKTFRYSQPGGPTNVKDMVGDRLRGLVGRISKGSEKGRAVNRRRRGRGGAKAASSSQLARDRARGDRAIAQGGSTSEARVGTGQRTTKPKAAGTKPVQRQTPKPSTKPKAAGTKPSTKPKTTGGGQSVLQKEIAGASKFIETYKGKKGMERAVKQARERLERLRKKKGLRSAQKQTGQMSIRKANRNVA